MELPLLPTVSRGVPEAEPIFPTPSKDPAVMLKPASASVPVTVRLPVVMSTAAVRVTVWPVAMITSSPATGAMPPTQVAPLLQLPVTAEVIVAAFAFVNEIITNKSEICTKF